MRAYAQRVPRSEPGLHLDSPSDGSDLVAKLDAFANEVLTIFNGHSRPEAEENYVLSPREGHGVDPREPPTPSWMRARIAFGHDNHLAHTAGAGKFPLIVNPLIAGTRFSLVILDGGSSTNVLYANTLDTMGIPRSEIRTGAEFFLSTIPGRRVVPLRQITFDVTFGDLNNSRSEQLTFIVITQCSAHHAVLGRLFIAKFRMVCSYVGLRVKMSGPPSVITINGNPDGDDSSERISRPADPQIPPIKSGEVEARLRVKWPKSRGPKDSASPRIAQELEGASLNLDTLGSIASSTGSSPIPQPSGHRTHPHRP